MIRPCSGCGTKNRIPAKRLGDAARCGQCGGAIETLESPYEINSPEALDELVADSPWPVLVDFWADWCGPCKAMAPELAKLAKAERGHLVVAKVNTDKLQSVAARFSIRSIPTLMLFEHGAESKRLMGARPAATLKSELGLSV